MILVTLPDYDMGTRYVSTWAKKAIDDTKAKGQRIIELIMDKVTRKNVEGYLTKRLISLVMFNGHGDQDCVFGQNNEVLVRAGENEKILKSKIIHALACNCALILGPKSISCGAVAFIGYKRPFIFFHQGNSRKPLDDSRARPFFESSNKVIQVLIKGYSVREAKNRSQSTYLEEIQRLTSSLATDDDLMDATFLFWNMQSQVCLGNDQAKIS